MLENDNAYAKYGPFGVCEYIEDDYVKLFKNGSWPDLTDIPVPEEKTAPAQWTDNNGNPPCANIRKCYECGGNNICSYCPWLQNNNYIRHGVCGWEGRGGTGQGRVNGDHGGGHNGDSVNITLDSCDGNRKPMATSKYIHSVDEMKSFTFMAQPVSSANSVSGLLW